VTAPLSVAERIDAPRGRTGRRVARTTLATLLVLLLLAGGWLLWDNRRLDVTEHRVTVEQLPSGIEGLRIAQVSDLHAADFGTFQERLVTATEAAQPDLIALTGDLVDHRTARLDAVLELAARLQRIAPAYFVLGNHEADSALRDALIDGLEERGVVVLRNEAVRLPIGRGELTVVGLDDPRMLTVLGEEAPDPALLLAGLDLPEDGSTVLLAHRPELVARYAGTGVDVVLSGHAHGGQVRVPGVGGLYAPHQGWRPALSEGVHERDGATMVISRGLGNSVAGVRVNNPRELVVVELHRGG
jgi:uncharacterized protein